MRIIEIPVPKKVVIPEYITNQIDIDPKTGIPFKVFPFTKEGALSLHASNEDFETITLRNKIEFVFDFDKDEWYYRV